MKCFKHHAINKTDCVKNICRYWIDSPDCQNCCIAASLDEEKFTLEEIGKIFKVTRMRICQVEKIAINKIKEKVVSMTR
jgi:hypothetical protein